jgi:hypothetical protein
MAPHVGADVGVAGAVVARLNKSDVLRVARWIRDAGFYEALLA